MYKWTIKVILKCGKELNIYYAGNEKSSQAVADIVLNGDINTFNAFRSIDDSANIFIKVGEISALSISPTL